MATDEESTQVDVGSCTHPSARQIGTMRESSSTGAFVYPVLYCPDCGDYVKALRWTSHFNYGNPRKNIAHIQHADREETRALIRRHKENPDAVEAEWRRTTALMIDLRDAMRTHGVDSPEAKEAQRRLTDGQ